MPGGGSRGSSGDEQKRVEHLGTGVVIRGLDDRGKIEIAYLSIDDLQRIIESMGAPLGERRIQLGRRTPSAGRSRIHSIGAYPISWWCQTIGRFYPHGQ